MIPRSVCPGCRRPSVVCVCHAIQRTSTRTRVVILQHPRERDVPINTARLAELQLDGAERYVGIELDRLPTLRARLSDPNQPAILLYPGPNARDLAVESPPGPVTLCVLDGTWWQAKKLFQQNPKLARLPRYRLAPERPSRYRIRREPAQHCVSTIEAIAQALDLLEPGGFDAEVLLKPFDAMVEHQLRYMGASTSRRHALYRGKPKRPRLPALLREREVDLVVGYGEANAWPRGSALGGEAEVVHWVAERVSNGQRFEAFIASRRQLSPSFTLHTQVAAERVQLGESFAAFHRRWCEFFRPTDVLLGWGFFSSERLAAEGVALPERLDLRELSRRLLRKRTGEVAVCAAELGATLPEAWASGRGGQRLSAAVAVARALVAAARAS
ncbi:MAG TPA: tRNA-uridine aminocarboxypropyltransferase [Polyangiaceae bacterium]|nr:tRNA-uridine aminocarboxypropyltransferase [Polyangiaceae bacterium]